MSKIENIFAESLEKSGLNFERNCRDLPGTPDVVFREQKLAVFFHGCFWHAHHCRQELKSEEWRENQRIIRQKDKECLNALIAIGYQTVIIWECEWKADSDREIKLITDRLYLSRLML